MKTLFGCFYFCGFERSVPNLFKLWINSRTFSSALKLDHMLRILNQILRQFAAVFTHNWSYLATNVRKKIKKKRNFNGCIDIMNISALINAFISQGNIVMRVRASLFFFIE